MDPFMRGLPVPNLDDLSKEQLRQWFLNYEDRHYDPPPRQGVPNGPRLGYSFNEGYRMVKFIHAFDLHDYIGGNVIWREMAKMRIVIEKTWHSMREHFCKTVVRDLVGYQATGEDILRFRQAQIRREQGHKHNPTLQVIHLLKHILEARSQHFQVQ